MVLGVPVEPVGVPCSEEPPDCSTFLCQKHNKTKKKTLAQTNCGLKKRKTHQEVSTQPSKKLLQERAYEIAAIGGSMSCCRNSLFTSKMSSKNFGKFSASNASLNTGGSRMLPRISWNVVASRNSSSFTRPAGGVSAMTLSGGARSCWAPLLLGLGLESQRSGCINVNHPVTARFLGIANNGTSMYPQCLSNAIVVSCLNTASSSMTERHKWARGCFKFTSKRSSHTASPLLFHFTVVLPKSGSSSMRSVT
mmetsp:Transcript_33530/g.95414  ORF Transcript_33530/g.95414 Transcript_33530/m.95414 type:complete len:251 (-) Transcript_33530:291-1043(-)